MGEQFSNPSVLREDSPTLYFLRKWGHATSQSLSATFWSPKNGMCDPGLRQDWTQLQVLQGVGPVGQSGVFCRRLLFDLDFYRADITSSSLFVFSLPKCLHQTRQRSHCLRYTWTEVVHCVQQFCLRASVHWASSAGTDPQLLHLQLLWAVPLFCASPDTDLHKSSPCFGLSLLSHQVISLSPPQHCCGLSHWTVLHQAPKALAFQNQPRQSLSFSFLIMNIFSWLFTHQVGKGKVKLRVSHNCTLTLILRATITYSTSLWLTSFKCLWSAFEKQETSNWQTWERIEDSQFKTQTNPFISH